MDWQQLLSKQRLGKEQLPATPANRTAFQRDFDRIIFSAALRRMQDKTQVFPLAKNDYVRTRLTHCLETSSVGRSLGTLIGEQIIARHNLAHVMAADFGDICAAACLAHDIGNPPFGHAGEDAIRHWACYTSLGQQLIANLDVAQRADLQLFEGNAQGFRILTHLQNQGNDGGLQLTCATLGAVSKYTRASWLGELTPTGVSASKFGFCHADRQNFIAIAEVLGLLRRDPQQLIWCRHPLAFLVEAADDICYRVVDIEDGFRLGHLSYQDVLGIYEPILPTASNDLVRLQRITDERERVEFLRARVINEAIQQLRDCFLDNEQAMLSGSFDEPLLAVIPKGKELKNLQDVAWQRIYCTPEVIEIAVAGFEVIGGLLERLSTVIEDLAQHPTTASPRSRLTVLLIPEYFVGQGRVPDSDPYQRLLRLIDFVSGMTDSYAVSLYKKLTGIALPD